MRIRPSFTAASSALLLLLLLLLLGGTPLPFKTVDVGGKPQRWPGGRPTIFVDPVMLPAHADAIRNASQTWSSVPGSVFRFVHGGSSTSPDVTDHGNGNSDLYFDATLPPFAVAITFAFETGENIIERDVAFNGTLNWTTTGSPGGAPDVETVALHELGHVLGLLHEDSVPSVMRSGGDPSVQRRALEDDDRAGVVFLYPAGGGGGGGAPKGPDLSAGTLLVTQGVPGAGRAVTLRAEVKNRSTLPAGPFRVSAVLVTSLPAKASDEELGGLDLPSLAGGATTTVDLDVFIPSSTPPGAWRLGSFVDAADVLKDPVRENNGAATTPFTVSREPVELSLGDGFTAGLGPSGADGGTCWIGAGTEVLLRAKGQRGVRPRVRVLDGPGGTVLALAEGRASAKLQWTAPADGTYFVDVVNTDATVGRFRLATSGRTRWKGIPAEGPAVLPFTAYAGGRVVMKSRWEGEAPVLLCRPPSGPDLASPGRTAGRSSRLGPLVPGADGSHGVVLGAEGGVRVTLDSRTPRPGQLVVR